MITHNETSTGVTNDLAAVADAVHEHSDALLLVDGVSSLAALPFAMDELGVDVVVTGSQKAWMVPPSLLLVGVGPRAWEATHTARLPRYYWDFQAQREAQARGVTPYTPPLSQLFALRAALDIIENEGLAAVYERHRQVGGYTRRGLAAWGLRWRRTRPTPRIPSPRRGRRKVWRLRTCCDGCASGTGLSSPAVRASGRTR